ncbi:MAG: oxidoreductase-like domain-containing protein [Pseudomonadota bacterium]
MSATPPTPPTRPDPENCCNRGCCPCIFDYYYDALDRWKDRVAEMGLDPDAVLAASGKG